MFFDDSSPDGEAMKIIHAFMYLMVLLHTPIVSAKESLSEKGKIVDEFLSKQYGTRASQLMNDSLWSMINQSVVSSPYGKGWEKIREGTVLNGYPHEKKEKVIQHWVEKEFGNYVLVGFLANYWLNQQPSYALYYVGDDKKITPGDFGIYKYEYPEKTSKYLTAEVYSFGSLVGNKVPGRFSHFDAQIYCEERNKSLFASFFPAMSDKSQFVQRFIENNNYELDKQAYAAGNMLRLRSLPQSYWKVVDEATGRQEFGQDWVRVKTTPSYGIRFSGDERVDFEAGNLIIVRRADDNETTFSVVALSGDKGDVRLVPRIYVNGKELMFSGAIVWFKVSGRTDFLSGANKVFEHLDNYCKSL